MTALAITGEVPWTDLWLLLVPPVAGLLFLVTVAGGLLSMGWYVIATVPSLRLALRQRLSLRGLLVASAPYLLLGTAMNAAGSLLLAANHYRAALLLTIYPSSIPFYVVPQTILDHIPDLACYLVGSAWVISFWAVIFALGRVSGRWILKTAAGSPRAA